MSTTSTAVAPIRSDYFTLEELAKELGRSTRTIERWEAKGIGPPATQIAGLKLYRIESVRTWLRSLEKKPARTRK